MEVKKVKIMATEYDIEEFEEKLKNEEQEKMMQIYPIKRKRKCRTIDIDFEKIRINRELNRVV